LGTCPSIVLQNVPEMAFSFSLFFPLVFSLSGLYFKNGLISNPIASYLKFQAHNPMVALLVKVTVF
jgi:hypothetical protein